MPRVRLVAAAGLAAAGALALLLAVPRDAHAQLGRKSWEFFPHIGALFPTDPNFLLDDVEAVDPGVLWGIYATYHYTDNVGIEMGFSKGTLNGPEDETQELGDVGLDFWELNAFVNSGALDPVQFFATAGGGLVNYDPEDDPGPTRLLLDAGVGLRWYKWKNIALRLELKDFMFVGAERGDYTGPSPADDEQEDSVHNFGAFAGFSLNF